ncbi:MAG: helix-turn-helix domain-containing protein [Oscillospiraceae bacterium]|jgi:predicted transcriptional regulator|nr:helix-turn-helix domain-containing protein [Oscillospiraceae bacterium]
MLIKRDIYALELPHRAVAIYMYLCDRADRDGGSFPAHRTIAAELRLSVSTVKRALADLQRVGCVVKTPRHRERGGQTSNLYKV